MIVYNKLFDIMKIKTVNWKMLEQNGISHKVCTNLAKNASVTVESLNKICNFFQCQPGDIMEWIPDGTEISIKERKIKQLEAELKQLKESK